MKKLIALLLALVMVMALAACGANENNTESTPATTTEGTEGTTEATTEATTGDVELMTYAEYAAAELGAPVKVQSCIQAIESWWDGTMQLYLQDAEGAYYVYDLVCTEDEAKELIPGTTVLVSGFKGMWPEEDGEIEIVDATYEIVKDAEAVTIEAVDATDKLGTEELKDLMNYLVSFKGLTVAASKDANGNEAAFLYKWDGSGKQGDDLYFNVSLGDIVCTFTVNAYMNGTGADSEVYKAVEALQVGDVIDVEGFLYWYEGAQPHVTSVTKAG